MSGPTGLAVAPSTGSGGRSASTEACSAARSEFTPTTARSTPSRASTWTVEQGEIVTLIGSNGAGKTTTLKTISGLLQPRTGPVVFDGQDMSSVAPRTCSSTAGIVQVPEGRRIFSRLTVRGEPPDGRLHPIAPTRADRIIERALHDVPAPPGAALAATGGTLSGGEQQMLAMGRALMSRPRLLLLDEPSLGLAPDPRPVDLRASSARSTRRARRSCWWSRTRSRRWPSRIAATCSRPATSSSRTRQRRWPPTRTCGGPTSGRSSPRAGAASRPRGLRTREARRRNRRVASFCGRVEDAPPAGPARATRPSSRNTHAVGRLAREAHLVGHHDHRGALVGEVAASPPAPRPRAPGRGRWWARRTAAPAAPWSARGRWRRAASGHRTAASGYSSRLWSRCTLSSSRSAVAMAWSRGTPLTRIGRLDAVLEHGHVREQVEVLEHHAGPDPQLRGCALDGARSRAWSGSASTVMSPMRTVPMVGSSRKLRQRRNVVLPLPDRPMIMTVSCWRTSRSTPRSTWALPKYFSMPVAETTTSPSYISGRSWPTVRSRRCWTYEKRRVRPQ